MKWRLFADEKPEDGQRCLTEMKHGFISGRYQKEDGTFLDTTGEILSGTPPAGFLSKNLKEANPPNRGERDE